MAPTPPPPVRGQLPPTWMLTSLVVLEHIQSFFLRHSHIRELLHIVVFFLAIDIAPDLAVPSSRDAHHFFSATLCIFFLGLTSGPLLSRKVPVYFSYPAFICTLGRAVIWIAEGIEWYRLGSKEELGIGWITTPTTVAVAGSTAFILWKWTSSPQVHAYTHGGLRGYLLIHWRRRYHTSISRALVRQENTMREFASRNLEWILLINDLEIKPPAGDEITPIHKRLDITHWTEAQVNLFHPAETDIGASIRKHTAKILDSGLRALKEQKKNADDTLKAARAFRTQTHDTITLWDVVHPGAAQARSRREFLPPPSATERGQREAKWCKEAEKADREIEKRQITGEKRAETLNNVLTIAVALLKGMKKEFEAEQKWRIAEVGKPLPWAMRAWIAFLAGVKDEWETGMVEEWRAQISNLMEVVNKREGDAGRKRIENTQPAPAVEV